MKSKNSPGKQGIDEASLDAWLRDNVSDFAGLSTCTKFADGQSNPTYRLVDDAGREYVLRRKPFGKLLPSAHQIEREFRVIEGLYPTGYPVAKPYALCEDNGIIGAGFYVMSFVEGRVLWDGMLPEMQAEKRTAIYKAMISTLAKLHNLDYQAIGLQNHGKTGNYFARQVHTWSKLYKMAETETVPAADKLIEWLPTAVPEQTRTSIVHGDYRIDNMIFQPERSEVAAVLDWELSTLGDPLADFTYFTQNWFMNAEEPGGAAIGGCDLAGTGIPALEDVIGLYCELTKRDGLPDLDWYCAYNQFRLMSILQGIKKRWLDGTASSAEAEERSKRVIPLAESAWEFARKAGAPA